MNLTPRLTKMESAIWPSGKTGYEHLTKEQLEKAYTELQAEWWRAMACDLGITVAQIRGMTNEQVYAASAEKLDRRGDKTFDAAELELVASALAILRPKADGDSGVPKPPPLGDLLPFAKCDAARRP